MIMNYNFHFFYGKFQFTVKILKNDRPMNQSKNLKP